MTPCRNGELPARAAPIAHRIPSGGHLLDRRRPSPCVLLSRRLGSFADCPPLPAPRCRCGSRTIGGARKYPCDSALTRRNARSTPAMADNTRFRGRGPAPNTRKVLSFSSPPPGRGRAFAHDRGVPRRASPAGLYAQVARSDDLCGPVGDAARPSPVRCTLGQGCMPEWNVILATLQMFCLAYPAGRGLAAVTACPCDRSAAWIFFEPGGRGRVAIRVPAPFISPIRGPENHRPPRTMPTPRGPDLFPLTLMAVRIGNLAVRVLSGFAVPQNLPGSARVG